MKKLICILSILAVAVCFSKVSFAAEHPGEHPCSPAESEHPGEAAEHPGAEHPQAEHPGAKAGLSAEDIIKGIKDHIASVTEANNGYFPITDTKEGRGLKLKLIRVHEDKVSYIKKEDAYFACTDFVTLDGKTKYDLDFWMKEEGGELKVYQTKIHKKDGNPRFTYQDDEVVVVDAILEKKGSGMTENKGSGIKEEKKGSGY